MKIYIVQLVRIIQTDKNFPKHRAQVPVKYFKTKELADIWISKQDIDQLKKEASKMKSIIVSDIFYTIEEQEVIGECEEQA